LCKKYRENRSQEKENVEDIRLKIAIENRELEIKLLWQRTIIFGGMVSLLFTVLGTMIAYGNENKLLIIPVTLAGLVISIIWSLSNRGSKAWQESWEIKAEVALSELIDDKKFYRKVQKQSDTSTFCLLRPANYSLSRLLMVASDFTIIIWIGLSIIYCPIQGVQKIVSSIKTQHKELALIGLYLLVIAYIWYIFTTCRSGKGTIVNDEGKEISLFEKEKYKYEEPITEDLLNFYKKELTDWKVFYSKDVIAKRTFVIFIIIAFIFVITITSHMIKTQDIRNYFKSYLLATLILCIIGVIVSSIINYRFRKVFNLKTKNFKSKSINMNYIRSIKIEKYFDERDMLTLEVLNKVKEICTDQSDNIKFKVQFLLGGVITASFLAVWSQYIYFSFNNMIVDGKVSEELLFRKTLDFLFGALIAIGLIGCIRFIYVLILKDIIMRKSKKMKAIGESIDYIILDVQKKKARESVNVKASAKNVQSDEDENRNEMSEVT